MERTDYIEKREDIISNIETLYSYLHGESGEDYKQWAIDRLKLGKNMVVEVINGHICFAPSRFVGYLNNTREKNEEKPGNGTDTDKRGNDQHNERDREKQNACSENGVRDIVQEHNSQETTYQKGRMTTNRCPMVHILVGQCTGRTKHLHRRNQAKEHEDDPNHSISLK